MIFSYVFPIVYDAFSMSTARAIEYARVQSHVVRTSKEARMHDGMNNANLHNFSSEFTRASAMA